jgi:para-nitrobenzyl esterase
MSISSSRRTFTKQAGVLFAGLCAGRSIALAADASSEYVAATTATGKVRGTVVEGIRIFKGIPYGGPTAGKNRFMPPTKADPWTGTRDALAWGSSAPQTVPPAVSRQIAESEDCLVLNVFTPALDTGKRPVMVWLHGGGWANGSGSGAITDGTNLARLGDVVVVSINHRLNVFGFTHLTEAVGTDVSASGAVGLLDIVAALQWVRDNIDRFGGDPNLVTIFGQSGGGRKVATLMSMPSAQGLFHRAIVESGAVLRLTEPADAAHQLSLLLTELGLKPGRIRELQNVPMGQLLLANERANDKLLQKWPVRGLGWTANTPTIDGKFLPGHPWDPKGPALSANIPLMIGWTHTEESNWERPTPEHLALDEAGLQRRIDTRLHAGTVIYKGGKVLTFGRRAEFINAGGVIEAYRKDNPGASPYELYLLIATDHPRGTYSRELARRKAEQGAAPVYLYRFDWETPEGGGMRSPHAVEVPFVFNTIKLRGKLIAQRQDAYVLANKIGASWVAFARTGNPNIPQLPRWPTYSSTRRDTMLLNNESRIAQDPDRNGRVAMESILRQV